MSPCRISRSKFADFPNQESGQYRGTDLPQPRKSMLSECSCLIMNSNMLNHGIMVNCETVQRQKGLTFCCVNKGRLSENKWHKNCNAHLNYVRYPTCIMQSNAI